MGNDLPANPDMLGKWQQDGDFLKQERFGGNRCDAGEADYL
jgi:hypothetical protein